MQDTTSSAMTEVALGLSMAFFTLLIVALLSMSVPKEKTTSDTVKTALKTTTEVPENINKSKTIDIKMSSKNNNNSDSSLIQFAFYFNNKFYDKSLALRSIDSFSKNNPLVIAVDPSLAFADVFTLKKGLNHDKVSITTLNDDWRTRLQHLTNMD